MLHSDRYPQTDLNKVSYKSPVVKSRFVNVIPKGYTAKQWEMEQAKKKE